MCRHRLCRCEPPPSPCQLPRANLPLDGGPNCAISEPCGRGLPRVSYQLSIDEPRGPRPQHASLRAAMELKVGTRRDGGGSHRRQPGCRERACPL